MDWVPSDLYCGFLGEYIHMRTSYEKVRQGSVRSLTAGYHGPLYFR